MTERGYWVMSLRNYVHVKAKEIYYIRFEWKLCFFNFYMKRNALMPKSPQDELLMIHYWFICGNYGFCIHQRKKKKKNTWYMFWIRRGLL
jgi:hypothetical protein